MAQPGPFSRYERMIAWRYLRATRAEGGVSVMTWISFIGIMLAVFALIATLSVRAGFRAEFVDTIVGANAHITYYNATYVDADGRVTRVIDDFEDRAAALAEVPGVVRAAPLVKGQAMLSHNGRAAAAEVYGMTPEDLATLPRIVQSEDGWGDTARYGEGVAVGSGIARALGLQPGDSLRVIAPEGVKTPFGTKPRVATYDVAFVFTAGRYDIDSTRIYMPFGMAQDFFNRQGVADEIEIMVVDPEAAPQVARALQAIAADRGFLMTWQDASGNFLRALEVEDNVMFVILSVLVLIAAMNIVSGLIMLVKNKQADIGILRTLGLSEGAVLRVFLLCGMTTGLVGTLAGVILGCLFAIYIDPIFAAVNALSGGGVWDPSIRGIYYLPARLQLEDVLSAVALSLGLSCVVTYFPARRAARLNPVEALRHG
ncbi:MAG: ABC transporter permease [Rhodobacteraceae bacterium]|nr:ABC transporter permease [Paracoccaceae bacterium]